MTRPDENIFKWLEAWERWDEQRRALRLRRLRSIAERLAKRIPQPVQKRLVTVQSKGQWDNERWPIDI